MRLVKAATSKRMPCTRLLRERVARHLHHQVGGAARRAASRAKRAIASASGVVSAAGSFADRAAQGHGAEQRRLLAGVQQHALEQVA